MCSNILLVLSFIAVLQTCFAPPVTQNKKEAQEQPDSEVGGLEDLMEYHRYLKEVVNALESDQEFRQKLEKADENDIKSGKIAEELQFVSHHVRSRLDEIKRVELQRLKELTEKKRKLEQLDTNSIDEDPTHHHLDQSNPHTFEIEDLKKLISKTTEDLAEADKKRKEEFKQYELEKEYQKQEKLNHTSESERQKLEKEFQEMEEKHKKHEKLHQPGHKAQLEEVWEEQDQMQQDFDPKTFFMLHDVDGNGLWDQEEVKALFIKELAKMYQEGAPEDDMRERAEEMERMRESVFNEMDTNKDAFIDYREFMQQTNSNDFKQDHGWQGLDEQTRPYTDEELAEYIRQHHGINAPQHGQMPHHPQAGGYQPPPPGAYQQAPPGAYQQVPPNQQFQPGQVPQMAPQQLNLNTNEIHPGQPQPPQYQQGQPQYQQQQNVANSQQQQVPQNQQQQYQQPKIPQQNQQQQFQQPNVPQQNQQQHYQQQNQQQHYQQPNMPQQNQQQHYQQPNMPQQNQQQHYQQPNMPQQNQQQQYQQPNVPPQNQQYYQQPNVQQQQYQQHPNVPQQNVGQQQVNQQPAGGQPHVQHVN